MVRRAEGKNKMVKPPQRPTPKTSAQKSGASSSPENKTGTSASGDAKPATSSQASAKRATPTRTTNTDGKLTPKPKTIDLKANDAKKPASSPAKATSSASASSSASTSKAGAPTGTASTSAAASAAKTDPATKPTTTTASAKKPEAKPSPASASTTTAATPKDSTEANQKRGGTSFLALLLAGIIGGIITLLGAFALLGSGTVSGLFADKADDKTDETQVQMEQLSGDVSTLTGRIDGLQNALDETTTLLNADAPDMSAPLAAIKEDISAVQTKLNNHLAAGMDVESNNNADNADALSEFQTQLAANATDSSEKLTELNGQLSELTARQAALENSVSAGEAGEAPALAALEQRLAAISDSQQAQGALVSPAVRKELATLDEELQKLQIKMAVLENMQLIAEEQQTELSELSTTVQTVAQKTDRLEASVEEEPPAESGLMVGSKLAYLQTALTNASNNGVPFVGLLQEAKALLAVNDSAAELPSSLMQAATTGVLPLNIMASQIETARAEYEAAQSTSEDTNTDATNEQDESVSAEGVLEGIMRGAQSLVKIRSVEPPAEPAPTDPVSALLSEASDAARGAYLTVLSNKLDSLAGSQATPNGLKARLSSWQEQVSHHLALADLSDQISAIQQTIWAQAVEGERP